MSNVLKAFLSGLSDKERKILYLACGVVCLALFDSLVLSPITRESRIFEEKIKTQADLIKKHLLILQYRESIIGEDDAYGKFFSDKDATESELKASFLSGIERMAKASKVTLTNISEVNREEKKDYAQYSLTVECVSGMENLIGFIYNIDSSEEELIRVASCELAPKKRETYEVKAILTVIKLIVIPDGASTMVRQVSYEAALEDDEE